jgi:hypothetical protein
MLGPEEIRDPVEGVVIDEDRAKQRLFRLDVMRRQSERGLWAGAGPKASSFGKRFDGWHKVSRPAPTCAAYAESVQDELFLWHAGAAKRREVSHLAQRLPLSTWAENFARNGWTGRSLWGVGFAAQVRMCCVAAIMPKCFTKTFWYHWRWKGPYTRRARKLSFGRNLLSGPGRSGLVALTQKVEGIMTFASCNKSKETHHNLRLSWISSGKALAKEAAAWCKHLGSGVHDINRHVVTSGHTELHRIWVWLCDHRIMAIILAAPASSATAYQKGVFDAIVDDVLPKGATCEANIALFCISYVFVKCSFSGRARV